MNKRILEYDIIKAICIIGIVLNHTELSSIYLDYFYIAGFYFVSGLTFKLKPFKVFIKSKIKRLYIPFVIANILAIPMCYLLSIITNYTIEKITIMAIIKIFLFNMISYIMSPAWFLLPFFIVVILLWLIEKFIKKDRNLLFISIISFLSILIFKESRLFNISYNNCNIITNILFGLSISTLGLLYQKSQKIKKIYNDNKTILFIISTIILLVTEVGFDYILDIRRGFWTNPILFTITTISGLVILLYISEVICLGKKLKKLLSEIGKYSMSIMLFHAWAFNIITIIYTLFIDKTYVADKWHNGVTIGGYKILNVLVGIFLPVLFNKTFNLLKNKLLKEKISN